MLARYHNGEKKVWSVVHVPSVEAEDQRHLHRQLLAFKADRTRHTNRMKGLLAGQGVRLLVDGDFLATLDQVCLWDGSPLPPGLRARLEREYACYLDMDRQIQTVEAERWEKIRTSEHPSDEQVRALLKLRGMGENSCPGRIIPSVTLHGDMMVSQATASGNRDAICPTQGER
jgi:transposase